MRINDPEPPPRNPLHCEAYHKALLVEEIMQLTKWSWTERRKLLTKPLRELEKFRDMVFAEKFPALP